MTRHACRFTLSFVAGAILSVAALGCSAANGPATESQPLAVRNTYEDHDHDLPAHMPVSYPAAVADLQRRHEELSHSLCESTQQVEPARFAELCDIVNWLPRLAADSDLTEAQWHPVHTATARLQLAYGALRPIVDQEASLDPAPHLAQAAREFPLLQQIATEHAASFEVTHKSESPLEQPSESAPAAAQSVGTLSTAQQQ